MRKLHNPHVCYYSFVYLGIIFKSNGSLKTAMARLLEQGRKAMFRVLTKSRKCNLPIDIQLQLYHSMFAPIVLYGAEVLGFENVNLVEVLYLQFYKLILKVKISTPNCLVYGELGRYPASTFIRGIMIGL
jgi:hypothetical protein